MNSPSHFSKYSSSSFFPLRTLLYDSPLLASQPAQPREKPLIIETFHVVKFHHLSITQPEIPPSKYIPSDYICTHLF